MKDKLVRSIPDNLIDDFKYFLEGSDRENPFLFWNEYTISHRVTDLLKTAGYQGYSLHSLRHTYLTILNELNYSVRQAQRIIDHKNILTTTDIFTMMFWNHRYRDLKSQSDSMHNSIHI